MLNAKIFIENTFNSLFKKEDGEARAKSQILHGKIAKRDFAMKVKKITFKSKKFIFYRTVDRS